MRLALSNITWDISEDEVVAQLLQRYEIDAIDIAPGKYFADPLHSDKNDILKYKQWWQERGIEITGMQALLFGQDGLNLFADIAIQNVLLDYLKNICQIAETLGASRLVFGSPKNRDRAALSDAQALEVSVSFFRRLGNIAQKHGVIICLEPNPVVYGANFMTTSAETMQVVLAVDHPSIKMQLDTGAITINGENIDEILAKDAPLIGHIHASDPYLTPLGEAGIDHQRIHVCLLKYLPNALVSIEMLSRKDGSVRRCDYDYIPTIEQALRYAVQSYRPPEGDLL